MSGLSRGVARLFSLAIFLCAALTSMAAAFTPGNIVVYRVGDGGAALGSAGTAVFLDEYTPAGAFVQSIAMPTTGVSGKLVASGSATTEGFLTRSSDKRYLIVPGYDAALGTASITSSTSVPRVIGRVDSTGTTVVTSSYVDSSSSGNIRSVASDDGTAYWASGSTQGVRYVIHGASTATLVSNTATNMRNLGIFSGQLYISSGAGTVRMATVGSGLPTSTGAAMTQLSGLPTATATLNGFFFVDLDGSPGLDTLYIADEAADQIQKWCLISGTWTMKGSVAATDPRGLTGSLSAGTVTFYASTGSTGASIVKGTDATGFNANLTGSTTSFATAGTNRAFRGVALAPENGGGNAAPAISGSPANPVATVSQDAAPFTVGLTGTDDNNIFNWSASTGTGVTNVVVSGGQGTSSVTYTVTLQAGFSGTANFTASLSDNVNSAVTRNVTISVLGPLAASGSPNPTSVEQGGQTLLTVNVTPGANPPSTGITVKGDLTSIGGSATQSFSGVGNTFTFNATVSAGTSVGPKSIPITVEDAEDREALTSIPLTVTVPAGSVVISQFYGGGGNTGATLKNDYIELFNRTSSAVSLDGWSVQHWSSSNAQWLATPLTGTIQPYSYYLVQEAAGAGGTVDLPTPDATGTIGLSSSSGLIVLSSGTTLPASQCALVGVVDYIGYGSGTSCSGRPQIGPGLSNTMGAMRLLNGCKYTSNATVATDWKLTPPSPRNSSSSANNCSGLVETFTPHVVISEVYGGGGNSGATFENDYIELYNPTDAEVSLVGWSIQYTSSTGSTWSSNLQPLGGSIPSHGYFLIELASGGDPGDPLPAPRIEGGINMSATNGKVLLAKKATGMSGNCPINDPDLVDFVGYGSADCFEGGLAALALSNNQALQRDLSGTDTDQNSVDFTRVTNPPPPAGTGPLVELPPYVTSFEPSGADAPFDASVTLNFSEPVDVTGTWYTINCTVSGSVTDVEIASRFNDELRTITPNVTFTPGETCTVHLFASLITDQDAIDGPGENTLTNDLEWTFTIATGTAPPETADVHLTFGNPSGAVASLGTPNNFLMVKPQFSLSYNRDRGTPNWVSWHLSPNWIGTLTRVDTFRPDPAITPAWYRVLGSDYSGSGFDRGHVVPNADRDKETSKPINQATFLMTNMIPQAPNNNQGPWAALEEELRVQVGTTNEMYIVAGGAGTGGTGSNGFATTIANGNVTVPASTWKCALVLPHASGDDVARVAANSKTICVIMPNIQGIQGNPWQNYLTTVDAVEQLTGYDLFSNVPDAIESAIEAGTNGTNPPGAAPKSVTTNEEQSKLIQFEGASPTGGTLTFSVVDDPAHGTLDGSGDSRTYTPNPNFNGTDTFTYRVHDGTGFSPAATVTITVLEVNDPPSATNDTKATAQNVQLVFPASDLAANDSAGPLNESGQTLTVTGVTATANTNGTVGLSSGTVTYTPASGFVGVASFTYSVCDNGYTAGLSDSLCTTGTVTVNVNCPVNLVSFGSDQTLAYQGEATLTATIAGVGPFTVTVSDGVGGTRIFNGSSPIVMKYSPSVTTTYTITKITGPTCESALPELAQRQVVVTLPENPTATVLTTSPSPSQTGEQIRLSARVTAASTPSGTVVFKEGATTLGSASVVSGVANLYIKPLVAGSHTYTAYFTSGSWASSDGSATHVVNAGGSTITLATSKTPANGGTEVDFTATVKAKAPATGVPAGKVRFYADGSLLGTATLNGLGKAVYTHIFPLTAKTYQIVAKYDELDEDPGYATSTSAVLFQTIQLPITVTLTVSQNPASQGTPLTFTATINGGTGTPTGTMRFYDGTTLKATISVTSRVVTWTSGLAAGTHPMKATLTGSGAFAGSYSSAVESVIITP